MFTPENFPAYANRIRMIVFSDMNIDLTRSFHELSKKQQRQVNLKINEYINSLPEDFDQKINQDFNEVCGDELFENFQIKASKMRVHSSSATELDDETSEIRDSVTLANEILTEYDSQTYSVA